MSNSNSIYETVQWREPEVVRDEDKIRITLRQSADYSIAQVVASGERFKATVTLSGGRLDLSVADSTLDPDENVVISSGYLLTDDDNCGYVEREAAAVLHAALDFALTRLYEVPRGGSS